MVRPSCPPSSSRLPPCHPPLPRSYPLCLACLCLCLLGGLLSGCWRAPPALDHAAQQLPPEGGQLTLPGGVSVTLSAGFLAAPAEVSVTRNNFV